MVGDLTDLSSEDDALEGRGEGFALCATIEQSRAGTLAVGPARGAEDEIRADGLGGDGGKQRGVQGPDRDSIGGDARDRDGEALAKGVVLSLGDSQGCRNGAGRGPLLLGATRRNTAAR